MEITGKYLLNKAESILKDRKQEARAQKSESSSRTDSAHSSRSESVSQNALQTRLLNLQESLTNVQNDYTREQTRFAYLQEHPDQINSSLRFNDAPLFPELSQQTDLESLKQGVGEKVQSLLHTLKSIQVEMENLVALNFNAVPRSVQEARSLTDAQAMMQLDPERVARLTRG